MTAVNSIPNQTQSKFARLGRVTLNLVLGPARVSLALILVAIIFQTLNDNFLRPINISNLLLQIVPIALISLGIVLVLIVGEIDLSVGAVSGLCGAILGTAVTTAGWSPYAAVALALGVAALIGALHGLAVVLLKLPSFIVTLSGLLAWQGAQLAVLNQDGTLIVNSPEIAALARYFIPLPVALTIVVASLMVYASMQLLRRREQQSAGVQVTGLFMVLLRIVGIAGITILVFVVLQADRGVALGFAILIALILFMNYVLTGSRPGRHLLAIGGNLESARRVGIKVNQLKVMAFIFCSMLAAAGGILAVSRLQAATQSAGGSDLLLLAIAGPVIAGVSLFGGRGSIWAALVGAVLIGAISNGMDLLGLPSPVKFIVTGLVLFLAVAVDAVAQLSRARR